MCFVWISGNTAVFSCTGLAYWLLSAFAILRQASIRFVMFVCPSVHLSICRFAWNISASTGRIFMIFDIEVSFENLLKKFYFHPIRTRITLTLFWSYLAQFFTELENFRTNIVNKIKKHILRAGNFFPKIVPFIKYCGKILYSRAGHKWPCGECAFHAGYLRLQTHAQNM
jgi:hypothetical protein